MATFSKTELIAAVALKTGKSRAITGPIVNEVFDTMAAMLARVKDADQEQDRVSISLHNFGTFIALPSSERTGRNPRTGEAIPIAAGYRVVFRPARNLKQAINKEG